MRHVLALLLAVLLVGCATPPREARQSDFLFHDELFGAPSERVEVADVFALSEPMRQYLRNVIAPMVRGRGPQEALVHALYDKAQLRLDYDAAFTRNAAQAFEARTGNCLSLAIMTAAFAREMGLAVRYQSALFEETYSRSDNLLVRSDHINISLSRRLIDERSTSSIRVLTIDFLPPQEIRGLRVHEVDEDTVVAMYLNNRAVEALVDGRRDDAYAWARAAVRHRPDFVPAQNTLGVIYLRHGEPAAAETVFNHVLDGHARNVPALSNLARALAQQGRAAEAVALYRRLEQLEPDPPFHYFNLGLAAMKRQDFRAARDLFAKETARADYYHEFHFWLAVASFHLGDFDNARRHLARAQENSPTRGERELYAAKLAWLKEHRP